MPCTWHWLTDDAFGFISVSTLGFPILQYGLGLYLHPRRVRGTSNAGVAPALYGLHHLSKTVCPSLLTFNHVAVKAWHWIVMRRKAFRDSQLAECLTIISYGFCTHIRHPTLMGSPRFSVVISDKSDMIVPSYFVEKAGRLLFCILASFVLRYQNQTSPTIHT